MDCTRVYHFGARYNVEMEIVLPGAMTVMESHDIALALQHKIESLEDVERAFVHVSMYSDYVMMLPLSVSCLPLLPTYPTVPFLVPGHTFTVRTYYRWTTRSATG